MMRFLFLAFSFLVLGFSQKNNLTIFLAGDSTMADKPYASSNPEKGWGQVFPLYFGEGISIENHAVNGRSTKSFKDEGRWQKILDRIKPGDYVIIEFGHNDQKSQDSTRYAAAETDYKQNLIRFVNESRVKGAMPILVTPIVRRRFDEDGNFYDTHGLYPKVVKEVAKEMETPLLDLHTLSRNMLIQYGKDRSKILFLHIQPNEYQSLPEGMEDDTHLSGTGAFKICDLAILELERAVPELVKFFKE